MRAVLALASLCIVAAVATELPSDVAAGFYPGRSAPIVVKADNVASSDASAIFMDPSSHHYYAQGQQLEAITAQNVADVTLRSVGLAPVSHSWSASSFVKNDYFDRARASVQIAVESVGDDVVNSMNLANLKNWRATETSAALTFPSYPVNSVALAASLASGVTPSSHGIVARSWSSRGQVVRAYSDASAAAQSPNVADILASSFDFTTAGSLEGKPLTVSASSDAQLAAAQCAHSTADNSYCTANAQLLSTGGSHPLKSSLTFTTAAINSAVLDTTGVLATLTGPVSTAVDGNAITVTYPGGVATLSLDVPAQRAVLAELQYALNVAAAMSSDRSLSALARDDAPDFFAFTFASLTPLMASAGPDSKELAAAMHLLDAVLPQLMTRMSAAYGERAVYQVVLMGSTDSMRGLMGTDSRAITALVSSVLPSTSSSSVRDYFPYVYASVSTTAELAALCERLAQEATKASYQVYCPAPEAAHYAEFVSLSKFHTYVDVTDSYSASSVSSADIQLYQITLWFTIGIILVLAAVIYSLVYMDIKRDSLVYAQYNPMWENRKGGK